MYGKQSQITRTRFPPESRGWLLKHSNNVPGSDLGLITQQAQCVQRRTSSDSYYGWPGENSPREGGHQQPGMLAFVLCVGSWH
jgi:hypothetical protein